MHRAKIMFKPWGIGEAKIKDYNMKCAIFFIVYIWEGEGTLALL